MKYTVEMNEKLLLKKLLKRYAYTRIFAITGISIPILKLIRQGKIPDNISSINRKIIPSISVLKVQIVEKFNKRI